MVSLIPQWSLLPLKPRSTGDLVGTSSEANITNIFLVIQKFWGHFSPRKHRLFLWHISLDPCQLWSLYNFFMVHYPVFLDPDF
jgi:hypothetical protein